MVLHVRYNSVCFDFDMINGDLLFGYDVMIYSRKDIGYSVSPLLPPPPRNLLSCHRGVSYDCNRRFGGLCAGKAWQLARTCYPAVQNKQLRNTDPPVYFLASSVSGVVREGRKIFPGSDWACFTEDACVRLWPVLRALLGFLRRAHTAHNNPLLVVFRRYKPCKISVRILSVVSSLSWPEQSLWHF